MPGYVGYHSSKKSNWSVTTTIVVVVAHVILVAALYQLSQTEYIQNLIKVSKLTTVQEPVKPRNRRLRKKHPNRNHHPNRSRLRSRCRW